MQNSYPERENKKRILSWRGRSWKDTGRMMWSGRGEKEIERKGKKGD
jgi:hypothetical protein